MIDTHFLYPKQSILEGVARLSDFNHDLLQFNSSKSSEEADKRALASDWKQVGRDIFYAIKKYVKQQEERSK